jgi:hydrogenase maturation protein HypF
MIPGDPVTRALELLGRGKLLAIKGIGGFHLACDAGNEEAVLELRRRKGRVGKPFALMAGSLEEVRKYCRVDQDEAELLSSPMAPIVLLREKERSLPKKIAPNLGTLGFMLPYTPVHHLLFNHPEIDHAARARTLVMTSGNRSEEPIARTNEEAFEQLSDLADAFLIHDREITLRADDSIFRVIHGRKTVFRRSRGVVPGAIPLRGPDMKSHSNGRVTLAAGGDLKNCMVIVKGDQALPGPHVGDLASPSAQEFFEQSIEILTDYLEVNPDLVAVDPHPEYFSTRLAKAMDKPYAEVFHHHAHAVSLLVEHGLEGPIVCAAFDGTGFGEDASIWGGEFLIADRGGFVRASSITGFPLPGGEAAIRFPLRILAGLLAHPETMELHESHGPLFKDKIEEAHIWLEAVKKNFNSPITSSAGRLFDAAAACAGFSGSVTFEGEAAMWRESMADPGEESAYPMEDILGPMDGIDPRALIRRTAQDILQGEPPSTVASRFHNTMAMVVSLTLKRISLEHGIKTIGLSGGCFQNRLFTERVAQSLENYGLKPLLHEASPPNDGGIALGQAIAARAMTD